MAFGLKNRIFGTQNGDSCRGVRQPWLRFALVLIAVVVSSSQAEAVTPSHRMCFEALTQNPVSDIASPRKSPDSDTRRYRLDAILNIRESEREQGKRIALRHLHCLKTDPALRTCPQTLQLWLKLDQDAKAARIFLSAAQSAYQRKTWSGRTDLVINQSLSALGSFKMKSWLPLTEEERGVAFEAFEELKSQVAEMYPSGFVSEKHIVFEKRAEEILLARYAWFVDYLSIMSSQPLLQWIRGQHVKRVDFQSALESSLSLVKRDEKQTSYMRSVVHLYRGILEFRPLTHDPLEYKGIVQRLAAQDEAACWDYLKMSQEYDWAKTVDFIGTAIMALPFTFLTGGFGVAAITILGAGWTAIAQNDFLNTQARELTPTFVDWVKLDMKSLREAKKNRDFEVLSIWIGLPVLRVTGGLVVKASRSSILRFPKYRNIVLNKIKVSGGRK